MVATAYDIRHRADELFTSLARGVRIVIMRKGKKAGILSPYREKSKMVAAHVREHPFFGSVSDEAQSVESVVDNLRRGRFDDL